jgi:hypothetical protein
MEPDGTRPVRHPDGKSALVGEIVELHREKSVVEHVLTTPADFTGWGLDQPGVVLVNDSFGRVFIGSADCADEDSEVVFVSRQPDTGAG